MLVPALLSVLEMMPLPGTTAREAQRWQTVITEEGIACRIAPADGMRVSGKRLVKSQVHWPRSSLIFSILRAPEVHSSRDRCPHPRAQHGPSTGLLSNWFAVADLGS